MKFADPREKCESLCFKPSTQRNLKHKAPSVRALMQLSLLKHAFVKFEARALAQEYLTLSAATQAPL